MQIQKDAIAIAQPTPPRFQSVPAGVAAADQSTV